MSDVIDLDALVPPNITVKFGGEEIQITPPKVADILRLGFLGQKLATPDNIKDNELDKVIEDLTEHVYRCIPQLAGKPLNTPQLLRLVEIIGQMATPPDIKDLQAKGISKDTGTDSPKEQ